MSAPDSNRNGVPDSSFPTVNIAHYRTPNWNPASSKVFPNESRFYEGKLKLQQFTGIKGPIRKNFKTPKTLNSSNFS
jgi:hypothetical protein